MAAEVSRLVVAVTATDVKLLARMLLFSAISAFRTWLAPDDEDGRKRVHQNATRSPRLTTRCCMMNRTTRMKKTSAAIIRRRSSQSDFSSAVMRCLEVCIRPSRTSCVDEADRSEAEEASKMKRSS